MMTHSFHRTSVRLLDGFEDPALEPASWQRLLERGATNTVFLTRWWQQVWWDVFGRGRLLLIGVFRGDDLVGVAPLFADSGMIFFTGSGGSDYLDFIGTMESPDVLTEVLGIARDTIPDFVGFRFYHIPDESVNALWLQSAAQRLGFACYNEGDLRAPFIDLRTTGDSLAYKKALVYQERLLKKGGSISIEHYNHRKGIMPKLDLFFEQHISRWASTPHTSQFIKPTEREFYTTLTERPEAEAWLRFTIVTFNKQPIAFHFGFNYGGVYTFYKPTYAVEYARYSPGQVLLRHILLAAVAENSKIFDFGLGEEAYKARFATGSRTIRTWGIYPRELASHQMEIEEG